MRYNKKENLYLFIQSIIYLFIYLSIYLFISDPHRWISGIGMYSLIVLHYKQFSMVGFLVGLGFSKGLLALHNVTDGAPLSYMGVSEHGGISCSFGNLV